MTMSTAEMGQALIRRVRGPVRLLVVAVAAVVLLIPLEMVRSVVGERFHTYQGVVAEIAGSWSGEQRLAGPILVVPYRERVEVRDEYVTPEGERKVSHRWQSCDRRAVILPETLDVEARLEPELRRRGIYEVRVYTSELTLSGAFRDLEAAIASLVPAERLEVVEWSKAVVAVGLSDPRGIVSVEGFDLGGRAAQARPGTTLDGTLPTGFHVPVTGLDGDDLEFRLPMVVRGSDSLRFLPLGETTRISLASTWPHPSFVGEVLPAEREVTADGFTAEWTIPLLNRSYPQVWRAGSAVAVDEIAAGVRLFEPVALYDLVTRAVKYGLLFIVLTFLTLGLVEVVTGARLRLVQYLLVGIALALFFLILIALAEHLGFAVAYLLAAAVVVVLNTLYCAAILGRAGIAAVVGAVLTATYGVLYLILEAEDFALLGGTALLVVALATTMWFTRRLREEPVPVELQSFTAE